MIMTTQHNYTSSITTKYGDIENVKADVKSLHEILARQGSSLLLDCIAEHVGQTVLKFKLNSAEAEKILNNLTGELKESIFERI